MGVLSDLRYTWRSFRATPAVTAVVLTTIAVAIGANTALFSIVYGVLWRPLPFAAPDRLMRIHAVHPQEGTIPSISLDDFTDLARGQRTFREFVTLVYWTFTVTGREMPARLLGVRASGALFEMLGVRPLVGRTFNALDDRPGSEQVMVIGYNLWRREFGGDRGIIGRTIVVNGVANTIIGVMPPGFAFPSPEAGRASASMWRDDQIEVWAPIGGEMTGVPRNSRFMQAYGRLAAGVSREQADAELQGIATGLAEQYPATNTGWTVRVVPAREATVGNARTTLLMLLGAVAIVLLVAGANVGSLLLARAWARKHEVAVRVALGASGRRLLRQFLIESSALACVAAVVGLGVAYGALSLLLSFAPPSLPRLGAVRLDTPVLLFSLGLTVTAALVFGILPMRHLASAGQAEGVANVLRESGPTAGRRRVWRRRALVASQIAMALPLLVGGGLLVRSFIGVMSVNPGFRADNLVAMDVFLTGPRFRTIASQRNYVKNGLTRLSGRPEIEHVAAISQLPLSGQSTRLPFRIDGVPTPEGEDRQANYRAASGSYLETMGIPLRDGRALNDGDTESSEPVAVVNEAMAHRYWPGRSAIGQRIQWTTLTPPRFVSIVGVVGDVRAVSLERAEEPVAYIPIDQRTVPFMRWMTFVARVRTAPEAAAVGIRTSLIEMDRDQPVYGITTMVQAMAGNVAERRFTMLLLAGFAAMALTLAAIGLYSSLSFAVARRRREIGIRIALGARYADIVRLVVGEGLTVVAAGLVAGLALAVALVMQLRSLLFAVTAADPMTFVVSSALILTVGVLASLLPARRAASVDPTRTMRD